MLPTCFPVMHVMQDDEIQSMHPLVQSKLKPKKPASKSAPKRKSKAKAKAKPSDVNIGTRQKVSRYQHYFVWISAIDISQCNLGGAIL